jgi:molybdopterin converting factor small subunit
MAVTFIVPGPLRDLAGHRTDVTLDGAAGPLRDALARLWVECPAVRDRVMTERGEVRPHVNVFVNGEHVRYTGGLDTQVPDGSEVMLVAAVSGG